MSEPKLEKFFKKDRWWVRISEDGCSKKTIPFADHVWLQGNPAFLDIPQGYIVHHLDYDSQNDDISNLALMQKHHHNAHHWKRLTIKPEVNLAVNALPPTKTIYHPLREPRIYPHRNQFRIRLNEKDHNGDIQTIWIFTWEGKPIKTREMAEWVKKQIWKA